MKTLDRGEREREIIRLSKVETRTWEPEKSANDVQRMISFMEMGEGGGSIWLVSLLFPFLF